MPRHAMRSALPSLTLAPTQPPAVVAQQLSDLLLGFPAAASCGVTWQVLVKKYEEKHQARLDIHALGHDTALSAASTLLWEVLRIVDKEDVNNPVVGVEDGVALVPKPGQLGSWPSLYRSLCDIVSENGTPDAAAAVSSDGSGPKQLLLSQIRPLLERYWHANFEESGLGFLNEEGGFMKLKKLKHLLQAVLRWREQRLIWRRTTAPDARPGPVDKALSPTLQLLASDRHNDLVLRCLVAGTEPGELFHQVCPVASCSAASAASAQRSAKSRSSEPREAHEPFDEAQSTSCGASASHCGEDTDMRNMQQELERLRMENNSLRHVNWALATNVVGPMLPMAPSVSAPEPELPADLFDDPFEPPPEEYWNPRKCSDLNSETMSLCSMHSSSMMSGTPHWQTHSELGSGCMTPQHMIPQQPCAFVPYWLSLMPSAFSSVDVSVIPRGIVQTAKAHFENLGGK